MNYYQQINKRWSLHHREITIVNSDNDGLLSTDNREIQQRMRVADYRINLANCMDLCYNIYVNGELCPLNV